MKMKQCRRKGKGNRPLPPPPPPPQLSPDPFLLGVPQQRKRDVIGCGLADYVWEPRRVAELCRYYFEAHYTPFRDTIVTKFMYEKYAEVYVKVGMKANEYSYRKTVCYSSLIANSEKCF